MSAGLVHELDGRAGGGRGPPVAPLPHRGQHLPEIASLIGEPVVVTDRVFLVGDAVEDTVGEEMVEPLGEDVAGDAESLLEVVEARDPEKGVPEDQWRPPLAHDLQVLGNRAVHILEADPPHDRTIQSCVTELKSCMTELNVSTVRCMTRPTAETDDHPRLADRPGLVLAIVCAGVVLPSLDLFIVNVALPQISGDFHGASLSNLSWVLNAYAIIFAALLVPVGRLADRASRKSGFLLGLALFTAASACCAVSNSVWTLVAFRGIQAVGAAAVVPTSLSLVLAAYPPARRSAAVRTWTAMGGLAAAFGPVAGGLLVSASWRWVFLVNIPVGIAALVAGARILPDPPGERGPLPDAAGTALLTIGIGALTFGLVKSDDWGWGSWRVIGLLVATAALVVAFLARSARHSSPVLELALLRSRSFSVTLGSATLFSAAFGAMLLSVVLWAQDGWGWSALRTGLAVAVGPAMVPLLSVAAGRLIPRLGPGAVIALGCTVFSAGVLWWAISVGSEPDYLRDLLGGMLLTGIGVGLTLPTVFSTAATSLPPARFATGSAVVSMARQIGIAVGVAVFVAVLGTPDGPQSRLLGFQRGWYFIAAISLAGGLLALALPRPGRRAATVVDDTADAAAVDGTASVSVG